MSVLTSLSFELDDDVFDDLDHDDDVFSPKPLTRPQVETLPLDIKCAYFLELLKKQNHDYNISAIVEHVICRVEQQQCHMLLLEIASEANDSLHDIVRSYSHDCQPLAIVLDVLWELAQSQRPDGFPLGGWSHHKECIVCLEDVTCCRRPCCDAVVCDTCLQLHLSYRLQEGHLKMSCPSTSCRANITRTEIIYRLSEENREKYLRFYEAANQTAWRKTCPRCCEVVEVTQKVCKKRGLKVECSNCHLVWCFTCQSPLHPKITCKQNQTGDVLLRQWAERKDTYMDSVFQVTARHAQKCPKCKFYIERIEGCNHMQCIFCNTKFCYSCGDVLTRFHNTRYCVLGCKKILLPHKPHLRRLVRGSILCGAVLASPFLLCGLSGFYVYKGLSNID